MFGYQGHDRAQPVAQLTTVPTEAQRQGDFSALLALGSHYQIYDPFTTVPFGPSPFRRDPLPGDIIPASRIDGTAKKILSYYPKANPAGTADGLQNHSILVPKTQVLKQPVLRADHVFSDEQRMIARYSHSSFRGPFDKYVPGSDVRGRIRARPHRGVAWDNVFVLSSHTVPNVRYDFTWFQEYQSFDNIGRSLAAFGFPDALLRELDPGGVSFPQIVVSGLLQLGNDGGFKRANYTHSLLSVVNWVQADHSFRVGADLRLLYENAKNHGNFSPGLDFAETYTCGSFDNSPVAPAGQGLASFLFGVPTGGWVDLNDSRAESSGFYSVFLQDDWRITTTPRLISDFAGNTRARLRNGTTGALETLTSNQ